MSSGTKYIKGNEKDKLSSLKKNDKDLFEKEETKDIKDDINTSDVLKTMDIPKTTLNTSSSVKKYNNNNNFTSSKNDSNSLLVAKAIRLVKEIGDYFKWSMLDINKKEKEAKQQPQKIIEELLTHYKEINKNKAEIKDLFINEMTENPEQLMFLLIKNGKKRKVILSGNQEQEQKILHGAILESVTYELSGFPKPSDVFYSKKNNDDISHTKNDIKSFSKEKTKHNQNSNNDANNVKKNNRFIRN